jgi:hypothetical protein
MRRIASIFLLQKLKRSMSGDPRNFNSIETRAVKFFFFLQGKAPKKIHAILTETLGEHVPSYAAIKTCVAQFNVVIFSHVMRLVLDDPTQSPPWRLLIKFAS